jgi:hypothetical protein
MKCPYCDIQCEYVDTAGMDKPVECDSCKHYKPIPPLEETILKAFTTIQMLEKLPDVVKVKATQLCYFSGIRNFQLNITKADHSWYIYYMRDRGLEILLTEKDKDFDRCIAKMLATLISSGYLNLNIKL